MTDLFINYGLFLIVSIGMFIIISLLYLKEIVDFLSKRRNPRICPSTKCYTQI